MTDRENYAICLELATYIVEKNPIVRGNHLNPGLLLANTIIDAADLLYSKLMTKPDCTSGR